MLTTQHISYPKILEIMSTLVQYNCATYVTYYDSENIEW